MNFADYSEHPYLLAYYTYLAAFSVGLLIGAVVL